MRRQTIIIGLICANLALLAAFGFFWKQRQRVATGEPASGSNLTVVKTNVPRWVTVRREGEAAGGAAASGKFSWRQLQSRDFKEYVGNLRAVDCPEETVKDIVVAEVNRQFAPRESALKARPEDLKPWESETRAAGNLPDYDRRRKLRELVNEKRATLKEILGYDVPVEYPPVLGSSYERYDLAFQELPESKREQARAIMQAFWNRRDELQARTKGFWEPEDLEEQQKLQRDRRDELAKLLTTDEFLGFEIRSSSSALNLRSQLTGFDASDREFREIFRLKQTLESTPRPVHDPEDREGSQKRAQAYAQASQQVEQQIKAALGEPRYAEYQRSQDYQFRNLTQIAQQYGLSKDVAVKAYEAQKVAQQEVAAIRSNPQYSPEQRTETLRMMQQELDRALTGVLGEAGYQRFQSYGGARIYNAPRQQVIVNADGSRTTISQ